MLEKMNTNEYKIQIVEVIPNEMNNEIKNGFHWARVVIRDSLQKEKNVAFGWYDNDAADLVHANSYQEINEEARNNAIKFVIENRLEEFPEYTEKDALVVYMELNVPYRADQKEYLERLAFLKDFLEGG